MENEHESALDLLWREYAEVFRHFDDLTLARWMAQTLGQLQGRVWRLSHPLVGAYRLASQIGLDRQIWLQRLATIPAAYSEAACCRAPCVPLFTRDIAEDGLICQHCGEPLVPFDELPKELQAHVKPWASQYATVHQVAHWDDQRKQRAPNYGAELDKAAEAAAKLLWYARQQFLPAFLDHYPVILWEDSDDCLDVRPEDTLPDR